jgi:predicted helicase
MTLEHLLTDLHSRTVQAKGAAFERLCRWYLNHDPRYAMQVHKVWLWDEWPGRWGADTGTDLIVDKSS